MLSDPRDGSEGGSDYGDDTCDHVHGVWREGLSSSRSKAIRVNTEDLLAVCLANHVPPL